MARRALVSLVLALSAALSWQCPGDLLPKPGALEAAAFAAAEDADEVVACGLAPNQDGATVSGRATMDRIELELVHLANQDRVRSGVPTLELDQHLLPVARTRAAAQVAALPLSHADASGGPAFIRLIDEMDLGHWLAGENLIRLDGQAASAAERAEQGFMNSPMHRANILDPSFESLAVGAAIDSQCHIVLVQLFRAEGRR